MRGLSLRGLSLRGLSWRGLALRGVLAAAAATALVIAVVAGLANGTASQRLGQAQSRNQVIAAVLTAPDATMMTGTVPGGGTIAIVVSAAEHSLVFTAAGLHALPAARDYELWLVGPAGDRSEGMLPIASHGMTGPVIALGLRPGDHLVLTAERASGAHQPTMPMMFDISV